MATVWPVGLPQKPQKIGYQPEPDDITLRSEMESGPPKTRKTSSLAIDRIRMVFRLTTSTHKSTLDTFYETTLDYGNSTFQWDDPESGSTYNWQFAARPKPIKFHGGEVKDYEVILDKLTAV